MEKIDDEKLKVKALDFLQSTEQTQLLLEETVESIEIIVQFKNGSIKEKYFKNCQELINNNEVLYKMIHE